MTMSDPAARTTRDTHRRAATTGLAVAAAGIVVFNIAPFLNWVPPRPRGRAWGLHHDEATRLGRAPWEWPSDAAGSAIRCGRVRSVTGGDSGRGEDRVLALRDGRRLAWCVRGDPQGRPLLSLHGTPGSRLHGAAHEPLWHEFGLRVISADRPGFGGSTRLPGRGIGVVADDLAELLDHAGIDRVPVFGASGGGPHVLALCARHPDRVAAATVVGGAAPAEESDLPQTIPINAEAWRRAHDGGWEAVYELLDEQRTRVLPDPLAVFRDLMTTAPAQDLEIMADPRWQEAFIADVREALRQGAEGWADEGYVLAFGWDVDAEDVRVPVVWWHGRHDANIPLSAVHRLLAKMPTVELRLWETAGHLEMFRRMRELLTDLLERTESRA